jgi:hypothetical protein
MNSRAEARSRRSSCRHEIGAVGALTVNTMAWRVSSAASAPSAAGTASKASGDHMTDTALRVENLRGSAQGEIFLLSRVGEAFDAFAYNTTGFGPCPAGEFAAIDVRQLADTGSELAWKNPRGFWAMDALTGNLAGEPRDLGGLMFNCLTITTDGLAHVISDDLANMYQGRIDGVANFDPWVPRSRLAQRRCGSMGGLGSPPTDPPGPGAVARGKGRLPRRGRLAGPGRRSRRNRDRPASLLRNDTGYHRLVYRDAFCAFCPSRQPCGGVAGRRWLGGSLYPSLQA